MNFLYLFAGALALAFLVTFFATPIVMKISSDHGFVDRPNDRKMHKVPIPYGGGIATFLGFLVASCCGYMILQRLQPEMPARDTLLFSAFVIGGFLSFIIGFIDDLISMPAKAKLLCQIVAVSIVMIFGVALTFVTNPFGEGLIYFPLWVSIPITIFWIVGIMNAVNLLDGLDGLLGGVSAISSVVFVAVAFMKGQILVALVMAALAGACLGFLKYNFNPAKIFMGDTGSLFIGMIFGIGSIMGGFKTTTTLAFIIPFLIMGLPIIDTTWAIIRRVSNRQPIFKPDKGHIHHRLLGLGLTQKQAVLIIYGINVVLGLTALAICYFTSLGG